MIDLTEDTGLFHVIKHGHDHAVTARREINGETWAHLSSIYTRTEAEQIAQDMNEQYPGGVMQYLKRGAALIVALRMAGAPMADRDRVLGKHFIPNTEAQPARGNVVQFPACGKAAHM